MQVVRRPGRDRPDVSAFLALFEHKIRDQSRLSLPEVQAIAAYLSTSVPEFSVFSHADAVLKVCALLLPTSVLQAGDAGIPDCVAHIPSSWRWQKSSQRRRTSGRGMASCLIYRGVGERRIEIEQPSLLLRARRAWCGRRL